MNRYTLPILVAFIVIAQSLILISCDEDDSPDPQAFDGDYFPIYDGKTWNYNYAYFTVGKDSVESRSEAKTIFIQGDTTIDGKKYKIFLDGNGNLVKVVRQEGTKFFGRNHEFYGITHEYMFLDTSIPVGGTWSYLKDDGFSRTEYIVKKHHDLYQIKSATFRNVLEIEVNYYTKNDSGVMTFRYSAKHFYTDGMGETYAFYPSEGTGTNEDLNVTLTGYHGQ